MGVLYLCHIIPYLCKQWKNLFYRKAQEYIKAPLFLGVSEAMKCMNFTPSLYKRSSNSVNFKSMGNFCCTRLLSFNGQSIISSYAWMIYSLKPPNDTYAFPAFMKMRKRWTSVLCSDNHHIYSGLFVCLNVVIYINN